MDMAGLGPSSGEEDTHARQEVKDERTGGWGTHSPPDWRTVSRDVEDKGFLQCVPASLCHLFCKRTG